MKRITALLLAVLSLLTFTACSKDDSIPEGFKLASDPNACAYSLYVPENWVSGNTGSNVTTVTVSNSDKCNISLSVVPKIETQTIGQHWEAQIPEYQRIFSGSFAITEDEQGAAVSVGAAAEPGYRYIFTANYGGVAYKFMQVFFIHGSDFYVYTYTALADHYDEHLEIVDGILSMIKF